MFRNLKALGLLVFAALAISATFAAGAQGQTHEETTLFGTLTSGTTNSTTTTAHHEKVDLHGKQIGNIEENFFEAFGTKIHCENSGVTYTGTATGTTTEVTLTPTYKDCTTGTNLAMTVTMNGCQFVFTHPETLEAPSTYTGKVTLTCPHEDSIDIEVYGSGGPTSHSGGILCTIRVHATGGTTQTGEETAHSAQELGGHVVYHSEVNEATGRHDVRATATITGISATRQGLCTFGLHQTTSENTSFVSKITLTATRDVAPEGTEAETEEPRDLWLSDIQE